MSNGFLIVAIVLNVGFALLVFRWALREHRRSRVESTERSGKASSGDPAV